MKIKILEDVVGMASKKVKGERVPFLIKGEDVTLVTFAGNVLIVEKANGERFPVATLKTNYNEIAK